MTLQEFYDALEHHDWYFDWSDDGAVWRRGVKRKSGLIAIAATSPEHQALYDAWHRHMFTGPTFGTEKAPKPERPKQ